MGIVLGGAGLKLLLRVDWSKTPEGAGNVRILVLGAGVIGSIYAGRLLEAGHEVVLMARGRRLEDLRAHGLTLQDAESGEQTRASVDTVSRPDPEDHFDLVLVPVRAEQLKATLPVLTAMTDGSDVLFFGNTANRQAELVDALGERVLFGFPAAGGGSGRSGHQVRSDRSAKNDGGRAGW